MTVHYEAYSYAVSATAANTALPKAHRERRPRGHDYRITIILAGERLDDGGHVVMPSRLGQFEHWLDTVVDGAELHLLMDTPPTVAAIAAYIYDEWWPTPQWGNKLQAVIVRSGDQRAGAYAPRGIPDEFVAPEM